jgi:hypothetical protein
MKTTTNPRSNRIDISLARDLCRANYPRYRPLQRAPALPPTIVLAILPPRARELWQAQPPRNSVGFRTIDPSLPPRSKKHVTPSRTVSLEVSLAPKRSSRRSKGGWSALPSAAPHGPQATRNWAEVYHMRRIWPVTVRWCGGNGAQTDGGFQIPVRPGGQAWQPTPLGMESRGRDRGGSQRRHEDQEE